MYYNWEKNINEKELNEIVKFIKNGDVIVFPTETVYGIGCNALDENAVKKVYEAKKRPQEKPLIILVSNKQQINQIAQNINDVEKKIIDNFMPGPLTLILEKKQIIPDIVSAGQNTIGIRVTNNEIVKKIIEKSGVPIVAPSANISGNPSGINVENIKKELGNKVSAIIDAGESKSNITSTIVKVINDIPTILRHGKVSAEEIRKVFEYVK